ncbi:MAG: AMP-dependent synthetase, partial [Actinobacteria bacterium]|nr:AMP-dependent synthetase [Actinomycetota bacterium]NIT94140.1 AMP-dependent synthetase [Actinomycetota bacterium]NIU64216.1 AMP-dependent synthetase [Actinomycetota bacterium]NIV54263.1 AMP-dependent synthetase [Actinomycetota bacterium]NIW26018.1 AMP-dependent synthetase [Actinomycetota bacterium]
VRARPARRVVVDTGGGMALEPGDVWWDDFLGDEAPFSPVAADPESITNVLFSSGTTGDPKAIPWTQLTPIKAAMDGHFHQDIHP